MNIWHDIDPARITSEKFMAVIEISKGSKSKYEMDKDTGMLKLDRVLSTSMQYPTNYGFIPRTLAEDGDPLDVLVLCQQDIQPMTLVECTPIGVIRMTDNEELDEKIIALPTGDPSYNVYADIAALPRHISEEIRHFFQVYKSLESVDTIVKEAEGRRNAIKVIEKALMLYKERFVEGALG